MAKRKSLKNSLPRQVEYYALPDEVIDNYARAVCKKLGETIDPVYNDPETIRDFSAFMRIVNVVCVEHINKKQTETTN